MSRDRKGVVLDACTATDRDRWTGITSVWQQDVGGCEMLQEPYLLDHASPAAAAIQTNCVNRGCSLLLT